MNAEDILKKVTLDFKKNSRNKIFLNEDILVASASEETGEEVTSEKLREVITAYLSGEISDQQESIYDGAVYVCGAAARQCFGDDPYEDIDYEIQWFEQPDGSFVAEVRAT